MYIIYIVNNTFFTRPSHKTSHRRFSSLSEIFVLGEITLQRFITKFIKGSTDKIVFTAQEPPRIRIIRIVVRQPPVRVVMGGYDD
jgi:hypothetical protein